MNKEYYDFPCSDNSYSTKAFDIRDYVQFDHNGRAECPHCTPIYNNKKKPLQVTNGGDKDGAYHCFRCQDPQAIREALGVPKPTIIPTNLAKPASLKQDDKKSKNSPQKYLVDLASITDDCMALLNGTSNHAFQALKWLKNRGILAEIVREYKLGLVRSRYKNNYYWSISIPILDEGKYHRKKRLIPWEQNPEIESNRPWSQAGIPAMPYFTHKPKTATQTWLCEGEWDAILLGWLVKHFSPTDIAVCTFTSGASNLPGKTEEEIQANLEQLPGQVKIFYDRNDKPDPLTGRKAAEEGARKVAQALKGRGAIAKVPMAKDCTIRGWDVSDAINAGYRIEDFEQAASQAKVYRESRITNNKINKRAMTSRNVFDTAPDYVEELWSGLFACNEMYLLAAPPRVGKSLFTLALAKAVATGTEFLGRPTKKGKVLLISKEDPNDKLKERMSAQDWGDEELDNISFLKVFTLDDLPDLIEYIEEEKPALLVLDTLSSVRTDNIDENSAKLSSLLTPLQKAAQENETCVLIVHHTSKGVLVNATTQEIFDKVRGSGALRGVCRGMIVLAQGEQYVRMVSEGGRYPVQELKIKLDPTDLIWKDLGKWRPPGVDRSQKQQVLQWLAENKQ